MTQLIKRLPLIATILVLCLPASGFSLQFLPTIEDTIEVAEWLYAGPFLVGAREGIAGVIDDVENFRPFEGMVHRNVLVQGGLVEWKRMTDDSTGWANLEYEDVLWDSLITMYGVAAVLSAGYAYGEFEATERQRALVIAEKVSTFHLNGKAYSGDPYASGYVRIPVILEEGVNRVLLSVGGFGNHRLLFRLVPASSPVMIVTGDATIPDLLEGKVLKSWVGITLLNTTEHWFRDLRVIVGDGNTFAQTERRAGRLAPLSVQKVPCEIELMHPVSGTGPEWLPVMVHLPDSIYKDSCALRVRRPRESFMITFLSRIDGSCQYYAVVPPTPWNEGEEYALILTLHGAGVEASRLVDFHQSKDWAFVVAPTNRGRYGFDWQDWGRLDALEVLDEVRARFPIDENRVYLTGHSMGGHGVWHIGLVHPDLFAAFAPQAGWISFQLYIPWFFQRSYAFAEPAQLAIRDMSLREDFTLNFVENGRNIPCFILHGGLDDNVPPIQSRMVVAELDRLGYEYVYKEVAGEGHWFEVDTVNKTVCVDDPELMAFLKSKVRDPNPKHIVYSTSNIGQNHRIYWIEIDEQERPFYESRVEARVEEERIVMELNNIAQFTISLTNDLIDYGSILFEINGDSIPYSFREDTRLTFHKAQGEFQIGERTRAGIHKIWSMYGPIKQAYFSPFLIVYGTVGDSSATDLTLHQARQEAFRWWHRGNGFVEIVPDTEVTQDLMKRYNLILFGGPMENVVTRSMNKHLPIQMTDGKVLLNGEELRSRLSVEYIYPNPSNPERFVFIHEGTDWERLKLSTFFATIHSGAGLPDFLIFDEEVREKGWGGIRCAGYFDSEWKVNKGLMYCRE